MKNYIFTILTCLAVAAPVSAQDLQVASPDGKLIITVGTSGCLTWSVAHDGDAVLTPSEIGLRCQVGKQTVELGTLTSSDVKRMKVARSGSHGAARRSRALFPLTRLSTKRARWRTTTMR